MQRSDYILMTLMGYSWSLCVSVNKSVTCFFAPVLFSTRTAETLSILPRLLFYIRMRGVK